MESDLEVLQRRRQNNFQEPERKSSGLKIKKKVTDVTESLTCNLGYQHRKGTSGTARAHEAAHGLNML